MFVFSETRGVFREVGAPLHFLSPRAGVPKNTAGLSDDTRLSQCHLTSRWLPAIPKTVAIFGLLVTMLAVFGSEAHALTISCPAIASSEGDATPFRATFVFDMVAGTCVVTSNNDTTSPGISPDDGIAFTLLARTDGLFSAMTTHIGGTASQPATIIYSPPGISCGRDWGRTTTTDVGSGCTHSSGDYFASSIVSTPTIRGQTVTVTASDVIYDGNRVEFSVGEVTFTTEDGREEQLSVASDFDRGKEAYQKGDYTTALREWRPLAEQGNVDAQVNLGWMYLKGQGVAINMEEAIKWNRQAAEQGDAVAHYHMGVMYALGHGVIADYKIALMWSKIAAANGFEEETKELRDDLAELMNAADISKAHELARVCVMKDFKGC